MKKIALIMTMVFGLIATAFAYDEVRFNKDGSELAKGLNTIYYGTGTITNSDALMNWCGISKDNLKELPADNDTYCLLYSIVSQYGYDWIFVESKNYIAMTAQINGWREYRIFKKTGSKSGKYLYEPRKLKTWEEILATEVFER